MRTTSWTLPFKPRSSIRAALVGFLVAAVVVAAALDIATYYRLPLLGATEANPVVVALSGAVPWLPVVLKAALGASVAIAVWRGRWLRFYVPMAIVCAAWWWFGAVVNSMEG